MMSKTHKAFYLTAFNLIPLCFILLVIIYHVDRRSYFALTREDHLLEWLTFIFLFLAGILSLTNALQEYKQPDGYFKFFIIFGFLCILFALEEISWGQRTFGIKSPDFFMTYSDQGEINVHNVIQETLGVKTKHLAGLVLGLYGAILPLISIHQRSRHFFSRIGLVVPPPVLSLSFILAAILMIDQPTGQEEEIGEFLFSVCFFLFMMLWPIQKSQR